MCRPAFTTNNECGDNHVQRESFKLGGGVLVFGLLRVMVGAILVIYPTDIDGSIVLLWVLCNSIYTCICTDSEVHDFINHRKRTGIDVFRSLRFPVLVVSFLLEIHTAPDLKLAKTLCIAGVTSFAWGTLVVFGSSIKIYLTISLVGSVMT